MKNIKLIDSFLNLFRKKEFYEINYEKLNTYDITFNTVTNEYLDKIKTVLLNFKNANYLDDKKSKLFEKDSIRYIEIEDLLKKINETILEDYRKTYFEAIENNWEFSYFVSDSANLYKNIILICNKLSHAESSMNNGVVIYPLLAVKRFNGQYYFWGLLEKYD